jgi:hypothetical protein
MLTEAQRLKTYGSPEAVAAVDRHLDELAAAAPPLTPGQKAALRVLLRPSASSGIPTAPATTQAPAARAA